MYKAILSLGILIVAISVTMAFYLKPNFNGPTPGCDGSNCHTHSTDISLIATQTTGLNVQVQLTAADADSVAGELVNAQDSVVDVVVASAASPFTLKAPAAGTYKINAGYGNDEGTRLWDSVTITVLPSDVKDNYTEKRALVLYQNHPNPANGNTLIRYYLPQASFVTLSVYDLKGNLILELVNEPQNEGFHQVMLDGNYLQAGTYDYVLKTGDNSVTRKMLIFK